MFTFRAIAALLMPISVAILAGCSQFQSVGYGEPNFNTRILLADLAPTSIPPANPLFASRDAATGLQPPSLPNDCIFVTRDPDIDRVTACVYAVKGYIDDQYREYRITLHHLADDGNALADITVLGLNTAGTAAVGAAVKTILSGIAAGVGGTKAIINQDVLYKRTIIAILNQMDADRNKQFCVMFNRINGGDYTIGEARDDLLAYFEAGTFDHGISSLEAAAAANKEDSKAQKDDAKVAASGGDLVATPKKSAATTCPVAATQQ